MVLDPSGQFRAWTGNGEESGYEVMFREEATVWSIKFPTAPESTSIVETVREGQPASVINTEKGLEENYEDWILTPSPGGGKSCDCPSALVDPELEHNGHC